MPDVRIFSVASVQAVTMDWLQTPTGLLDETQELATAVLVALNTDALASINEVLPDPRSSDRRGWWGDLNADVIWKGWPIGWKGWLLSRAKILDSGAREGATVVRIKTYIMQALQPFIDNRLASQVTVELTGNKDQDGFSVRVIIYRGPKSAIQLDYQALWAEIFPGS